MDTIKLIIKDIRQIKEADIELPFENGIYTIVGPNGCGKSTLMEILSLLLPRSYNRTVHGTTEHSSVQFTFGGITTTRNFDCNGKCTISGKPIRVLGLYEGSLFYGTRFEDSKKLEFKLSQGVITDDILADADDYLKKKISYILHGDLDSYNSLKRIKNKLCADRIHVKNRPYFIIPEGKLISQYRMSSGECLLISLLHFLYNSIVRRSLSSEKKLLVLIDELELALHPIAVIRLLEFLQELVNEHNNLIIFLSSHSPEVIKKCPPRCLYRVNLNNGVLTLEDNCYPSYLIRDLYSNVAPDFLLLVEDTLAQKFVQHIFTSGDLRLGKLIHVVPVGGWSNVLELHTELYSKKVLGHSTKIISVLDGDVENKLTKKQKNLPHLFLPIPSIEKYLYSVLKENKSPVVKKLINDKFFVVDSVDEVVSDYNKKVSEGQSDTNKGFYSHICKKLSEMGTSEDVFIEGLCDVIRNNISAESFTKNLDRMLNQ